MAIARVQPEFVESRISEASHGWSVAAVRGLACGILGCVRQGRRDIEIGGPWSALDGKRIIDIRVTEKHGEVAKYVTSWAATLN